MNPELHFEAMWAQTMKRSGFAFHNLNVREQEALKELMKLMFVTTAEMVLTYIKEHPEELPIVVLSGGLEDGSSEQQCHTRAGAAPAAKVQVGNEPGTAGQRDEREEAGTG